VLITTLILTRHGEARCNLAGLAGGDRTCTGLTPRGRQQVSLLAARLEAGPPADVLYASPRRRTLESAQIISDVLRLPVRADTGLRGPDHGQADGRPWEEIKAAFGGPPQAFPDKPYAQGSESWNQYLTRASAAIAELARLHQGQRIVIVGHGETIEAAFTLLLDLPPGSSTRAAFQADHASITTWQMHRNQLGQQLWILAGHNDTRHLG
jgi:2,3-bisphosphoglycerate-dependent phosphoglycerate mutase